MKNDKYLLDYSWGLTHHYKWFLFLFLVISAPLAKAQSPEFTSDPVTEATVGEDYQYNITTQGWWFIKREIKLTDGKLPDGIKLNDHGDGTAVLEGKPKKEGKYPIELTVRFKSSGGDDGSSDRQQFTINVSNRQAKIHLSEMTVTYDGKPHIPNIRTEPEGLKVKVTFDGSTTPPTDAGTYQVNVTIDEKKHSGSVNGTFTIKKASAKVMLSQLEGTYNGAKQSVNSSTSPEGLRVKITYDGSTQPPTDAGNYQVKAVIEDKNYQGNADGSFTIHKADASVVFESLKAVYDGKPKNATVTTTPAGLNVGMTYDGSKNPPVEIGDYEVTATVEDKNYQGTASSTFMIRDEGDFNGPPVISNVERDTLMYFQGSQGVPVTQTIIINDFDDTHIYEARIGIDENYIPGEDILHYDNSLNNNITGYFDADSGIMVLSGMETRSGYEQAISNVTYENLVMGESGPFHKNLRFTVKDSADYSAPVMRPIGIKIFKELDIVNAFTPNGDSVNDLWDFVDLENYSSISISVFNRDGIEVFKCLDNDCAWDGRYNGKSLPADVYFYIIDLNNGRKTYKGTVTILR